MLYQITFDCDALAAQKIHLMVAQHAAAVCLHTPQEGDSTITGKNLRSIEKEAITSTLQATGGNISTSAKLLGIGRSTLYRKMMEYGIPAPSARRPQRLLQAQSSARAAFTIAAA